MDPLGSEPVFRRVVADVGSWGYLGDGVCDELDQGPVRAGRSGLWGEPLAARRKFIATQMEEDRGDERARLFNPLVDVLPLVVRKTEKEGENGVLIVQTWLAQPWFARLHALSSRMWHLAPGD